jgi:hypothetical protein
LGYLTTTYYGDVKLDEIAYYNRALTADERERLYNSGNGREYCEVAGTCATPTPTLTHTFTPTATATNTQAHTVVSISMQPISGSSPGPAAQREPQHGNGPRIELLAIQVGFSALRLVRSRLFLPAARR